MNLSLGQAAWTAIFRELGCYAKPIKALRDVSRKLDLQLSRIQIVDNNASASLLSGWTLAGVVLGTNTNELGQVFPRVAKDSQTTTIAAGSNGAALPQGTINVVSTAGFPASGTVNITTGAGVQAVTYTALGGGGTTFTGCTGGTGTMATGGAVAIATVSLYTATGASGLVAQGSGAYPSTGSIPLTAQNGSGLSGTVTIGSLSGSETTDAHYLTIFPDFIINARNVFNGSQPEHGAMLADLISALQSAQGSVLSAIAAIQAVMVTSLGSRVARTLTSAQAALINLNTKLTAGQVTTDYSGVLEDLRADMVDETPTAQTVLKNVVAALSAVFAATNDGKASLAGPTLAEFAMPGNLTAVCIDPTRGSEQFQITQRVTGTNAIIAAKNNLMIDQLFADPSLGIVSMKLSRTLTLATGLSADFGSMSNWTLTGLSSQNTDSAGKLWVKVIVGINDPTKWIIQLYSSSTFAAATLVSQSAEAATSATGVVLTAQNGFGLGGVVAVGSGPMANDTGSVNCNFFAVQNAAKNVADTWSVAIAQTSAGEFQDLFRALLGYALNSASSAPTIADGMASAGTFPPYVVRDV